MLEALKDFLSGVNYDEEYVEDNYDDYEEVEEVRQHTTITPRFTRSEEDSKILNFNNGTNTNVGVVKMSVLTAEDCLEVVKNIKKNRCCIIKVGDSAELTKQNNVDFINGALYALDGFVEKISDDMIIATPKSVEIRGSFYDEMQTQSSSFFRMKSV